MRINQFLAQCGLGSRRKVEDLIISKKIRINSQIAQLQSKVRQGDKVEYGKKVLKAYKFVYYLLYKPTGYTSTLSDPHAEKIVTNLIPEKGNIFPVGRLDRESEGLIILTNDGKFSQSIIHPKYHLEKEYLVHAKSLNSKLSENIEKALKYFLCGIILDGKKTLMAKAKIFKVKGRNVSFRIILSEGRKRQIRRTLNKAGFEIISLKRIRIGQWKIGCLKPGQFREIFP